MSLLQKKRVLYGCSPHAFKDKGGGEVLLLKSKRYIERLGFNVEVFNGQAFAGFELFHNFNVHRDCFSTVKNANRAGLKVVISPVYWPSLRYVLLSGKPFAEKAKAVAAGLLNRLDVFGTVSAKKMLAMANVVTPSSLAEAAMLESMFKVPTRKIWVVHNGVEERFSKGKAQMFEEKFGLKVFALFVGRIEERKNLLSLVRAMKGTGKKLVVIGNVKHGSQAYFDKCKKEAGNNVLFLPGLPHDSKMLESAYAACRAFVLPSWYETPGLAALEAGLAKANIVVTREGPTKEYFAGFASYVNPASVADIREKVLVEMQKPKSNALSRHIGKNFLWQNTAKETKQAYERAMETFK